jgi:Bacterial protein of unknown function (DUF839)
MNRTLMAAAAAGVLAASAGTAFAAGGPGATAGPTTTVAPYVLPIAEGVTTRSLLTVGDKPAGNGFRMVGIPDGLGATRSGDTITVFMNQELGASAGAVRRHGQRGSFVSKLQIDARTGAVQSGSDLINPGVRFWDYPSQTYGTTPSTAGPNPRRAGATNDFVAQSAAFARFCSGTLSAPGQLLNRASGRGYDGQLYFANEENGIEGRTFAVTADGDAQQLPRLGLFSWENTKPAATKGDGTLAMGQEDAATGQIWAYSGTKRASGAPADRAGLTDGTLSVIDTVDETISTDAGFRARFGKGTPVPVDLSQVDWDQNGARQNDEAAADGLTLNRIEDGSWDPSHPNDFYLLTTEGQTGAPSPTGATGRDGGGLWRLRYEDIERPELGGTLTLLLDGSERPFLNKPDNMDIDTHGNLLIQEDPGGNDSVARIVGYRIADGALGVIAQFDPAIFAPGATDPKSTTDEESSGIIDAKDLFGNGTFMFDAQVHKANPDPELVEEGQLLTLSVSDFDKVYGSPDPDPDPVTPATAAPGRPVGTPAGTPAGKDATLPALNLLSSARQSLKGLRGAGLAFRLRVSEPVSLRVTLSARRSSRRGGRGPLRRLVRSTVKVDRAGELTVRLRPSAATRRLLLRERSLPAVLSVAATDAAGNLRTRTKTLRFR